MGNEEFEELMESMHMRVFHMEDADVELIIDDFIEEYPELLTRHDRQWYIEHC